LRNIVLVRRLARGFKAPRRRRPGQVRPTSSGSAVGALLAPSLLSRGG
jgi:hypothetical protein